MTIGIYKLTFNNIIYIGQSINIEKRYYNHISEMKQGISSKKLQEAYNTYGQPILEIVEETSLEELDIKEIFYISKYDSIKNGLNSVPGGSISSYGENNPAAKYTKETYLEVLFYLANTNLSIKEIVEITETSLSIVKHISELNRHSWLQEADPENYKKLLELRLKGNKRCAISQGIKYPIIVSPEGIEYTITNTRKFSTEHNIPNGSLCGILNGTQKTSKGWHLKTTEAPKSTYIKSPEDIIYEIPYRGIPKFCIEHNLNKVCIRDLIKGKQKSHKGWTLAKALKKLT